MFSGFTEKTALVRVEVRVGDKENIIEVAEGTPVEKLIEQLEPKWRKNVLVIVNGQTAKATDRIHTSDRILIVPLLSGG